MAFESILRGLAGLDPQNLQLLNQQQQFNQTQDMQKSQLLAKVVLEGVQNGTIPPDQGGSALQNLGYGDLANQLISQSSPLGKPVTVSANGQQAGAIQTNAGQLLEPSTGQPIPGARLLQDQSKRGVTYLPTTLGYVTGDLATGSTSPTMLNGKQLQPSQYDITRQSGIAGGKAGAKAMETGNKQRLQGYVNDGQTAADGMAVVKRSLELLNHIKTGGFNTVANKAQEIFGVQGADAAELSANLGKHVLAQLRPTFGAQFTEREGQTLKNIESSFGKSTPGNIRLLNQALQIYDRAARRGMDAAKQLNDNFAYSEIKKSYDMKLGDVFNPNQGPKPGTIENGFRFKGGDPSNPNNWEKVNG